MRGNPSLSGNEETGDSPTRQRAVTELPPPTSTLAPIRVYGGGARPSSNDGVFANLSAKPEHGEKTEEQPPVSTFPFSLTLHSPLPHQHKLTKPHYFPRPTNKPPQTPPLPTGKPRSSPPASPPTKSTTKASPSAPSFPLSGTA